MTIPTAGRRCDRGHKEPERVRRRCWFGERVPRGRRGCRTVESTGRACDPDRRDRRRTVTGHAHPRPPEEPERDHHRHTPDVDGDRRARRRCVEGLRHRRGPGPRPRRHQRRLRRATTSRRSWARPGRASRRCCTAWPDSTGSRAARSSSATSRSARASEKQLTLIRRDRVGFIFQSYNLIPTLNAVENMTLPMSLAGTRPDSRLARTRSSTPSGSATG